jgi:transcription initiation factor TFIIH subunit 4
MGYSVAPRRLGCVGLESLLQTKPQDSMARRVSQCNKNVRRKITDSMHTFLCLLPSGRPWSMFSSSDSESKTRDVSFLDQYAMSRWNCLLHYMVDSNASKGSEMEGISVDAVRIILHANLMKRNEQDGSSVLTSHGFQFLLMDTQSQVWHFMLQYLNTCEQRGLSLVDCLSMLFQLSFSTLGRDYSSEGLSENMLTFLQHLREFGLVYQRKRKEKRFFPTRLALNFTTKNAIIPESIVAENKSSLSTAADDESNFEKGYIIVETNYRVYAYSDSKLQTSLLALFTELLYRFPNVTVGVITRDSIRQALRGGISARQIISYLEQHAHPRMVEIAAEAQTKTSSVLPPTVVDQIKLWENERNRFTFKEGVVYNQFLSEQDFMTLRDYASSIDVLLWQNDRTRTMVVTKTGHDDVKKFWKRYSKGGGG